MSHRVVITAMRLRHLRVTVIERLLRVVAVMAVMMVRHVGIDVRLIVIEIDRLRLGVIRGERTVIVRRRPARII